MSAVLEVRPKRARPNWGLVIAHETTIATLRAELDATRARISKWAGFAAFVGFLVGAVVGRAIQ